MVLPEKGTPVATPPLWPDTTTVHAASAARLLCAGCRRHLQEAADLVEALMDAQRIRPKWLPRSAAAAARMLHSYERLGRCPGEEVEGATVDIGDDHTTILVHVPLLWAGSDTLFSHECALLRVALLFFHGHGHNALPRGAKVGHTIADWIVRSVVTDCLRLHGGGADRKMWIATGAHYGEAKGNTHHNGALQRREAKDVPSKQPPLPLGRR